MRNPATTLFLGCLFLAAGSGCGNNYIPNTTVDDSSANRSVVQFVEQYRHAVERGDVRELLELASPAYYDDNGSPVGGDDIDYNTLRDKLSLWAENLLSVRYEILYRQVEFLPDRIYVVYRFTASFRIVGAEGEERWERRVGDNRITLARVEGSDDGYRIVAGM